MSQCAAGQGQPAVPGRATEPTLGLGLHVCLDLAGLAVRGLRDRRVCSVDRGLAGEQFDANGLRARRVGTGAVRASARARQQPGPSLGPRFAIRVYSVQRASGRGRYRAVGERKGDSYDNALAETINGLYKAELIHRRAPWKTKEAVELATLEWVAWFNNHRLLEPIGYIPPAEAEANYYRQLASQAATVAA